MKAKFTLIILLALAGWRAQAQWEDLNPGGGGQTQDVVCDPNIEGRLYFSSDMEGVYRSDDNGETWHYTSDELVHARSFITTVDYSNSNRIYVGTMYGLSISDNAGDNYFFAEETANHSIGAVAVDPFDPNHIIAGSGWKDDYDFWTWGLGQVASRDSGNYFQSYDYGVTWTKEYHNNIDNGDNGNLWANIYAVKFDPTRQGTIYIAGDQGLYKTTDGGANWNLIPGPTQFKCRGLDISADGNYLYATYATDNGDFFNVGTGSNFYATSASDINWQVISGGLSYPGANLLEQLWYPEVDQRSTGNTHEILVAWRNQRSGVWKGTAVWNGGSVSVTWDNILNENDNFDPGWDTFFPNPNVRWAHFTPPTWDRAIWATGNQTIFRGEEVGGEWQFSNKYCEPSTIITPATGEPTYHNKGFASTFTFDGSAYNNYAIQSQGDNGIQESWDYGYSWNNHSVREFNAANHADAVDFAEVDGVPTVVVAAAKGWGGVNLHGHTLMTKKLETFTPSDSWQGRNGNLPTNFNVKSLRVSPHNKKSVLMGVYGSGLWWIEDIKDFINGGNAVKIADKDADDIAGANSIAFHPTDPNVIYAATNIYENSPTTNQKQHLYKGTRNGSTWNWEVINNGTGWGASVVSWRHNGQNFLMYSGVPAGSSGEDHEVQLSIDGGNTWVTVMNKETTLPLKDHAWYEYISNSYIFRYGGLAAIDNQLFLGCYHHEYGKPYGAFRGIIEDDLTVTWEDWTGDIDFPGFTKAQIKNVEGLNYYYGSTAGTGLWRREITPVGSGGPIAPGNLTAATTGQGIEINWSDNSNNETKFRIERGNGGNGYGVLKEVGANTTTYIDADFCPGRTFSYRVRAINDNGVSTASNSDNATSSSPDLPSGSSAGLIAEYFNNINFENRVSVAHEAPIEFDWRRTGPNTCLSVDNWSARWTGEVTAPTSGTYTFEGTADDAISVWIDDVLIIEQTLADPNDPVQGSVNLVAGQPASIKIEFIEEGWDANIVLKWSTGGAPMTVVPASALSSNGVVPPTPPTAPTNLSVGGATKSSLNLSWNDNSDNETGFRIERQNGGNWSFVANAAANATTFTVTGLNANTSYSFRLRSFNSGGESAWAGPASGTTLPPASQLPQAPSGLTAVLVGAAQADLTWIDNSDNEENFVLERNDGTGWTELPLVGGGITSFSDTGLNLFTSYTYRVKARNEVGDSGFSNEEGVETFDDVSNGTIGAKKVSSTITVDGNLTESEWDLHASTSRQLVGTSDNSVTFGALWDDSFLYVAIRVIDANLQNDSGQDYQDDATEVYIDGGHEHSNSYDGNDRQFTKGWNAAGLSGSGNNTGVLHAWGAISGGYVVEYAIPWSNVNQAAFAGKYIGFDVAVNDDDNGGDRDGQIMWNGQDNNWSNASAFGDLYLSSITADGGPDLVAPTVSITSPTNGASFTEGNSIVINASASDSDGSVSMVEFYEDGNKIGEDASNPYSFTWNGAAVGTHSLSVKATDNDGLSTTAGGVSVTVNQEPNNPPTITITSPADGATFDEGSTISINASSSDSDGTITKVEFFAGGIKIGEDTTSPYSLNWSGASVGTHSLTAMATDDDNAQTTSTTVNVTVNSVGNNGNSTVIVRARMSSGSTDELEVRINGSTVHTFNVAGNSFANYTTSLPVNGNFKLYFPDNGTDMEVDFVSVDGTLYQAEDQAVNETVWQNNSCGGSFSQWMHCSGHIDFGTIVGNGSNNTPPTASISSPSNGANFTEGNSITINASASDSDGTVTKVEFYAGSTKIGEDTTNPYSLSWSSASVGTHSLTVVATDDDGAETTSSPVSVTVNQAANVAPTVSITSPSNGASFTEGNSITINVTASDSDGNVTKIEFYAGGSKIGEDTTNPYSFIWNGASIGNHSLTAVATDDDGAQTTSSQVGLTVDPDNSTCTNPNLVSNGEFESNTNNWTYYNNSGSGASGSASVSAGGMSGTNAAKITISNGGSADSDIQFFTNVSLQSGKTYEVIYQAKAASSRSMRVQLLQEGTWANYGQHTVSLSTSPSTFTFDVTMNNTDNNARLDFFVGNSTADVYIDAVIVREKCPEDPSGNGCTATGNILYERYNGISGTNLSALKNSGNYPGNPSSTQTRNLFEAPQNVGDNYGARMSGYICAPETGSYTFWVAGDDNVELWLSSDAASSNKSLIASHNSWTSSRQWNKFGSQKSQTITLIQGQSYYVEALMKEGAGGDNLAVGWRKPSDGSGSSPAEVIPGSVLSPSTGGTNARVGNNVIVDDAVQNVKLYPNPVSLGQNLKIVTGGLTEFTVDVINMNGQVIYRHLYQDQKSGSIELSTGNLHEKGLMLIRIQSDQQVWHLKALVK